MTRESDSRVPPTLATIRGEFIELVGMIAQGEGLPRTAGRLFGLLIFDGTTHAFGNLARELQVSRASISTSVRLLEERGLIRRLARAGDRHDYFQLADDPFGALIERTLRQIVVARREIEAVRTALPADAAGQRRRLGAYADFYRSIATGLDRARERLETRED